ncbi:MAG: hypothetical protein FWC24_01685 [Treponema sp.]|nr:hypothetical protein [Treponema sp.]
MPWRLVVFIGLFLVLFLFIIFNLENKCSINFGFTVIEDLPIFVTVFFAFIAGMLCSFPFFFGLKSRKKANAARGKKPPKTSGKQEKETIERPEDANLSDRSQYGID